MYTKALKTTLDIFIQQERMDVYKMQNISGNKFTRGEFVTDKKR